MKPRNRRLKLGAIGGVLIAAAGVAGIIFPRSADFLMKLAVAVAALFTALSGSMAVDDVQSAKVDVARINAQTPPDPPSNGG